MTKLNVAYVPDEMWVEFECGAIGHFEYGSPISTAVYADGQRVEFDSTVDDLMISQERRRSIDRMIAGGAIVFAAFHQVVERRDFRGVIVGLVE